MPESCQGVDQIDGTDLLGINRDALGEATQHKQAGMTGHLQQVENVPPRIICRFHDKMSCLSVCYPTPISGKKKPAASGAG